MNSAAFEWRPGAGWAKVPGSEASGPNGLVLSKDGKWIYMNAWGSRKLMRLSRGVSPPEKTEVDLGFRGDNLRWAPDGTLLTAGLGVGGTAIARIDPQSLNVTPLFLLPDSPSFIRGTVVIEVGDEIWLGSSRSDRVVRLPNRK